MKVDTDPGLPPGRRSCGVLSLVSCFLFWWSSKHQKLVGGLEHFLFSHILGIIIPIDFHIFQRGSNHQPGKHCRVDGDRRDIWRFPEIRGPQ